MCPEYFWPYETRLLHHCCGDVEIKGQRFLGGGYRDSVVAEGCSC